LSNSFDKLPPKRILRDAALSTAEEGLEFRWEKNMYNVPAGVLRYLEHKSKRRGEKQRETILRVVKEPTESNLLAASLVLAHGSFEFVSLPNLIGAK
jgi:hypothetical protein